MSIFQAVILGATQGLTEFLPISSSGHLVLIPRIFGWDEHALAFDTVLHLGTAVALCVYFWRDFLIIVKDRRLVLLLLIGSIPAGLLGVLFDEFFESYFRSSNSVAVFLLVGSMLMLGAEICYKKVWYHERINSLERLNNKKSLLVGIFQALALFPGLSRSGATISSGMLFGLTREMAARFSFLLSVPIVVGAGLYKVASSYEVLSFDGSLLVGFLASFLMGTVTIKFLLNFLKTKNLVVFIVYRTLLFLLIIFLV